VEEAKLTFPETYSPAEWQKQDYYTKHFLGAASIITSMADLSNPLRGVAIGNQWNCKFLFEVDAEVKERDAKGITYGNPHGKLFKPTSGDQLEAFKKQENGFVNFFLNPSSAVYFKLFGDKAPGMKVLQDNLAAYTKALNDMTAESITKNTCLAGTNNK
jgi:hypothetical protein